MYVPSSELGLSHPLSRQRVCPSPQNRGVGTLACTGEGLGGVSIPTTEKVHGTLSTLWDCYTLFYLYSLGEGLVPAGGQAEDALQVRL